MKKNFKAFKRIMVFCLTMALVLANSSVSSYAADISTEVIQPEMDLSGLEDNTSVTYNLETNEIAYGADQNVTSTDEIAIEDNSISPKYIFGNDDRRLVTNTLDSPYRNICQLHVTYSDGTVAVASGTLVYFDVVLTAAHCIYNHEKGWPTRIEVVPGRYGRETKLGQSWATSMTVSNNWINNHDYDYDWAILDLQTSFSTWQLYACYQNGAMAVGRSVRAIGYPSNPNDGNDNKYMYEDTNVITASTDLHIDGIYDMTKGESGGAIIDVNTGYLVGVIIAEVTNAEGTYFTNRAVLITPDLFQRIKAHQY